MRLAQEVASQAAKRVGSLAVLTASTVAGWSLLYNALQVEAPLTREPEALRLNVLFLVLMPAALAALYRWKVVTSEAFLDIALLCEVAGSLAIGLIENLSPWQPDNPVRGSSLIAAWIAVAALAIPHRPWKCVTAAFLSAAMAPVAHLVCAGVLGRPPLPWKLVAVYSLGCLFAAGWTVFISTRVYRIQEDLSHAKDLGSYRLDSLLGQGGMGEVWRASHRLLRRNAAVKLLRSGTPHGVNSWPERQARQRFEREAQAIASLRSPHTVALYDFGMADDGRLYYVMELLEGVDMQTLVTQDGPQPAGRVIALVRQACHALEEAHALGLVHRDIKPTNLFVCRFGAQADFVKVLDFGLVKNWADRGQHRLTMEGTTPGTPAFMAPEQALGDSGVDARADIYSLGCVAYFLLTGHVVFEERSQMAVLLAHMRTSPLPPSQRSELPIPASLDRVVMACLEKKPERRPQSATELRRLLDDCTDVPPWTDADALGWWKVHHPGTAAS